MFDSKRVNESKLSINPDFKKSGMLIQEAQHESDSEDKITTITGIVGPNQEFLEDKPIKVKAKEPGPKIDGAIKEYKSIADRVFD